MAMFQPAALVMIPSLEPGGRRTWLTVTRPEPPHEAAIPGGLIEPGETPEVAAAREALEETGVVTGALERVGIGEQDGRLVHVFLARRWSGRPWSVEAAAMGGRGGRVAFSTWPALRAQAVLFGGFLDGLAAGYRARYGMAP